MAAERRRRDAEMLLENARKVAAAEETQRFGDFVYASTCQHKITVCLLQPQIIDELLERHAVVLMNQPRQMCPAVTRQRGECIDAAAEILQVLHLLHGMLKHQWHTAISVPVVRIQLE